MQLNTDFGNFASPRKLVLDILSPLKPRAKIMVADYAKEKRRINNPGSYVGPWDHAMVPYAVEPMNMSTSRLFDTMAIVGPGQSAKTSVPENILLHKVVNAPGKMLWYMQSDDAVEAYVKDRINPMIEEHYVLQSRLGGKPVDDSLHYKGFDKMNVEFLPANAGTMINKNGQVVVADEIDAYAKGLGDVRKKLDIRRQIYGVNSMLIGLSHPDRANGMDEERDWTEGIMSWYRDSTRGIWYWKCPKCGKFSSPNPKSHWHMPIVYRTERDVPLDVVAREAHMLCPHEGCKVEDHQRHGMSWPHGRWVHRGQEIAADGTIRGEMIKDVSTYGVWIVGAMSPFVHGGIGGMAKSRVDAERNAELNSDEDTVKEVMVKMWGFPHKVAIEKFQAVDVKLLEQRADTRVPLGIVPDGVRFIIVAVDTQGDRFVVQVEGFGVDLERWVIDRFEILRPALQPGQRDRKLDPGSYPEDWDLLEQELVHRAWPFGSDLETGLRPCLIVYDAYGVPGVTDNAYDFWLRMQMKGLGQRIMPLKGEDGFKQPRVILSYMEAERKDKLNAYRQEVPVLRMKVNPLKDTVNVNLKRNEKGMRFINFPAGLPASFYAEYAAEERGASGWVKIHARNESFDLSAYTTGAAYHLDANKIDWTNPPIWARLEPVNPFYVNLAAPISPQVSANLENHGVQLTPLVPATPASIVDQLV